jgi:sugar phosphate isomerase/epimerase
MKLQIGLNGRFFPSNWRPARDEIAFARRHGFAALQFPGKEEGLAATHLGDPLPTISQLLREAGLLAVMEIVVRIDAQGRTATGKTPLEILRANLPAITALPCRYVHWHLALRHAMAETTVQQLEASLLPQFVEGLAVSEANDFRFGLEHNEPELLLFGTPEACQTMLDAVPGLGLVWDLNHTTPDHLAGFQALIPRMSMLHIADTPLPEVNHHLPLGAGNIDFAAYGRELHQGGFAGPAILEIGGLPKSGGYGRDTDEALVDSGQRLQQAFTRADVYPKAGAPGAAPVG